MGEVIEVGSGVDRVKVGDMVCLPFNIGCGFCKNCEVRLPAPVPVVLIGAAAMALSDVPLKVFGISDPADWEAKDWAADAL
jgi:threonine dehydrogenase-like Zn-dependent dehydrogenase